MSDYSVSLSPDVSNGKSDVSKASTPESMDSEPSGGPPELDGPFERPKISYNVLIARAIQNSPYKRLKLTEIYDYITANYPYYGSLTTPNWQNNIRHKLSVGKQFQMVKTIGKGNYWEIIPDHDTAAYINRNSRRIPRKNPSKKSQPAPLQQASPTQDVPVLPIAPLDLNAIIQDPSFLQMLVDNFQNQLENVQNLAAPSPPNENQEPEA